MSNIYRVDDPREVVRPFLWVAGLAFSTGFLGYLALELPRAFLR